MSQFLKSDLFRNFLGGFALGAIALVAIQPMENRQELGANISALYSDIQHKII